jgi:hypothetical protein
MDIPSFSMGDICFSPYLVESTDSFQAEQHGVLTAAGIGRIAENLS